MNSTAAAYLILLVIVHLLCETYHSGPDGAHAFSWILGYL